MKFVVTCISEESPGYSISGEIDTDFWFETFPVYLAALRGAGFSISEDVALADHGLAPGICVENSYLIHPETDSAKSEHSKYYYDMDRNA